MIDPVEEDSDNLAGEEEVGRALDTLLAGNPPASTTEQDFLGAQFDAGLAFVNFPREHGGLGLSRKYQPMIDRRLSEAKAPVDVARRRRNTIGYGSAAPTIMTEGSDAQRRRYLKPLFTCAEIWCQLFTEPGAGSDLAGLGTRAVRDGREWVVNGQKVWTTSAQEARFGLLLARTDPQAEKHKGLTYFVVDMRSAGVEVRPLQQITGDAEFSEVFFTDVRVPDEERLSDVGAGWKGALVTLMNERMAIGGAVPERGTGPIALALDLWRRQVDPDPVRRARLVSLWIEAEALRLTNMRAASKSRRGTPGPEGAVSKLANAELSKRVHEFCLDLEGAAGMLHDSSEMTGTDQVEHSTQWWYLRSRADSIRGGTSDIMRNILAERILGLPSDVRVDKDRPWSEIPRS